MDISSSYADNAFKTAQGSAETNSFNRISAAASNGKMSNEKIRETAVKFESMFLSQMFSFMQPQIETDSPFTGGKGEEVFKSFMINEYANLTAKAGKIGIADAVERELIRMQSAEQI